MLDQRQLDEIMNMTRQSMQYSNHEGSLNQSRSSRMSRVSARHTVVSYKLDAYALAPIIATLSFIATVVFNALAVGGNGLFANSVGDITDRYPILITPADETFQIWTAIGIYQILLLIYWYSLLCRRDPKTHKTLYKSIRFISPSIAFFYTANMACNIAWLFMNDEGRLIEGLALLSAVSFTLYICLAISFHDLRKNLKAMVEHRLKKDIIFLIAIFQNGLAIYATWVTIATLFYLNFLLTYQTGIELSISQGSTITLGVLIAEIFIFLYLDQVLLERSMRYLFTPYLVIIVGLVGILINNYDTHEPTSIITLALLAIASVLGILKVILSIHRSISDPLYVIHYTSTLELTRPVLLV